MRWTALAVLTTAVAFSPMTMAQEIPVPAPVEQDAQLDDASVFVQVQGSTELQLSDVRGRPITNDEGETLGAISEIVFAPDGQITAVVIGVGGFLGIGVKDVAIAFDQLTFEREDRGVIWHFNADPELLTAAPTFTRLDQQPVEAAEPLPVDMGFVERQGPNELMLGDILGRSLSNGNETFGDISNLMINAEGEITVVVVGVGGFLGVGEKRVGISYDAITTTREPDNNRVIWLFEGTREDLQNAQPFVTLEQADTVAVGAEPPETPGVNESPAPGSEFATLAADVAPAVVSIRSRVQAQSDEQQQSQLPFRSGPEQQPRIGQGSGFFVSPDGFIVTNNHVVQDAQQIAVALSDGSTYPAEVIGTDPRTDIALLKVEADRAFPFVHFAEEPPMIGEWVLAVGNPYGLGGTVTLGIVSALGRNIGAGPYDDFMQIDAAINAGNSGGPAFNLEGEVVGVNTAIFSPTGASVGIGFSIPAYIVSDVVADLQDDGVVERGWLGVRLQPITQAIADVAGLGEPRGALVVDVVDDTPAATADIRPADVILYVNDVEIEDDRHLARTIASFDPGEEVALTIWRDDEEATVGVVLGELPSEEPTPRPDDPMQGADEEPVQGVGLAVAAASAVGLADRGVAVLEIDPDGRAARSDLRPGDVIIEVDGVTTDTPEDLVAALDTARTAGDSAVLLRVMSEGSARYVALRIGD